MLAKKTTAAASGKWWGIATSQQKSNMVLDTQGAPVYATDYKIQALNKRQRKIVRQHKGSLEVIAKAVRVAVLECKYQFKSRRWNCPTKINDRNGNDLFGDILNSGCRETAFVNAITSGAVTHSIARACSEGSLDSCSCDYTNNNAVIKEKGEWQWGGCSDNAQFGKMFSKKFVDAGEKGKDLRFLMNLHNNEAGRRTIVAEMHHECKCHGMSGSCAVKTCWMRLPTFRKVGGIFKDRFDGASLVAISNSGNRNKGDTVKNLQPSNPSHKPATKRDLVYFEDSPDFCSSGNGRPGEFSTSGRECNSTSLGLDGCELMCCGRGYRSEIVSLKERCSCTFQWCCKVQCEECTTIKEINKCL
uniref:Protein Wnt n=1 Tax=Himerometra robustipinna TaxID=706653 RepID=A0A5B8GAQ9_9ECHI|nr:Wnt1 [Himerometra robustipinna]